MHQHSLSPCMQHPVSRLHEGAAQVAVLLCQQFCKRRPPYSTMTRDNPEPAPLWVAAWMQDRPLFTAVAVSGQGIVS